MTRALRFAFLALSICASSTCLAVGSTAVDQAVAAVCNKRVVLLGELPSHGEVRAFVGKAAAVKALVARCGFDAVLFEAPLYEFVALEPAFAQHKVTAQQLDDAIGKFWWATELSDWRSWLLQSANEGRLRVGGIDDQVSATSVLTRAQLPGLVARYVPTAERKDCLATVKRQLDWSYDDKHPFNDAEKRALGRCSGTAAGIAVEASGDDGLLLTNFDGLVQRQTNAMSSIDRDAAMQRNLLWHLRRLPPGSKVVVWTANVHAAKRSGGLSAKPMGAWLAESSGDELGSIAFTALDGQSSRAGGKVETLPKLTAGSLEAKALAGGRDEAWVPAPVLRDFGESESRLYGEPAKNEWATRFDGVVVYRTEKPPTAPKASAAKP
jgi:erythromycin esterase-like protein